MNTARISTQRSSDKQLYAVIGGLGAVAGTDILHRVVKSTPAQSDSEHLDIEFVQHPFFEDITPADPDYDPTHRKFYVYNMLRYMEAQGRNIALLPCFVAQIFLHEITPEVSVQVLGIMDAIKAHLTANTWEGRIGILTSTYVRNSGYFEKSLGENFHVVYPGEEKQHLLMDAVYGAGGIKSGGSQSNIEEKIKTVCLDMVAKDCDLILPGFTDIPATMERIASEIPVHILNSNQIYADFAVSFAAQQKKPPFKIGVVGGVGPAATTDFMSKIISKTSATRDQDHIKMLVEQNPQIPDRTENILGEGDDPTLALYSCAKKLEQGGANIVAIPCNTAHTYVDRIQRHLNIPIINMLTETVDHIQQQFPNVRKIGLLATTGTVKSNLYQTAAERAGLCVVVPDNDIQTLVMASIYGENGVKAGYSSGLCKEQLLTAYEHLEEKGAEVIILGCTELPLIAPGIKDNLRPAELDPTAILAGKCVRIADQFKRNVRS